MIAKFPRTGAEVIFRSADAPDRLRGPNLNGVYLDEASLMPEDVYNVCIGRLRKDGKTGVLRAAFTPQGRGHWTYKVFGKSIERDDPDVGIVSAKTNQNPFLPETFDKMVRQQYGAESRLALQELDADFLPEGMTMFARQWFQYHAESPPLKRKVRAWDLAATETKAGNDPDFTVGALIGETADKQTVVTHIVRDRLSPLATKKLIQSIAEYDGKGVEIIIEQEPGAAAKILVADLIRDLSGWIVRAKPSNGTKAERAGPLSAATEAGNVALIRSPWNEPFLDEAEQFPGGKHDDQIDATALGFNHLHEKRALSWVVR
jgi:predicted phage terminase large subunit-like protein